MNDKELVYVALDQINNRSPISLLIHGSAKGADRLAAAWAFDRKVNQRPYPANWDKFGKQAGPIRNKSMLKYGQPDLVVGFQGGSGTRHMMAIARNANVPVVKIGEWDDRRWFEREAA